MKHTENDFAVFRNSKGEEKTIKVQELRNSARGQQEINHTPRFDDTPVPNLKTGLDYVEKATHKREDAMVLDRIVTPGGRVITDYESRGKKWF